MVLASAWSANCELFHIGVLYAAGAGLQVAALSSNAGIKGKKTWLGSRGQAAPGRMQIVISSNPQQVPTPAFDHHQMRVFYSKIA